MATATLEQYDGFPDPADGTATIGRRSHQRLDLQLPVECSGSSRWQSGPFYGITTNISTGGVSFELEQTHLQPGDIVALHLTFPAAEGVWPSEAAGTCRASVLRCTPSADESLFFGTGQSVAAQFIDKIRFDL